MKKLLIIPLLALVAGCSGLQKRTAVEVIVATDHLADEIADEWSARVKEQIAECREALPSAATPDERLECLGDFHPERTKELIIVVRTLVKVQNATKDAAECEELRTCAEETDWAALALEAKASWNDLKPFVETLRK